MGLMDSLKSALPTGSSMIKKQIAGSTDVMKSDDRTAWLKECQEKVAYQWQAKFRLGWIEHGGDLGGITIESLLNEMEQEALDQLSYIHEIKRRLEIK